MANRQEGYYRVKENDISSWSTAFYDFIGWRTICSTSICQDKDLYQIDETRILMPDEEGYDLVASIKDRMIKDADHLELNIRDNDIRWEEVESLIRNAELWLDED